jgi:hypothetical protein
MADRMSARLAEVRVYIAVIEKDRQVAERQLQEAIAWRIDCRQLLERTRDYLRTVKETTALDDEQCRALYRDVVSALEQGQV